MQSNRKVNPGLYSEGGGLRAAIIVVVAALLLIPAGVILFMHAIAPEPALTPTPTVAQSLDVSGTLTAHFIDVGQGDATLLQGPDFTILIDAGRHDRNDVVPYLRSVGVQSLDLIIGTHPHADHIGQFAQVFDAFPVREAWLSGDESGSATFERALDAILDSDADYHEPRAGETFDFGSARVEVYNPHELTGNVHEGSISLRLTYGAVAFIFTGDAEAVTEQAMIARGHDLRAQVLQLGHHGSRTSSALAFLQAVQPEVAIYSAAEGNSYGHPHAEVIDRLANLGIPVYGTDRQGTIRVITDGVSYEIQVARNGTSMPSPGPEATPSSGCREGQVNINAAPKGELVLIVHIGEGRAETLIGLRPFSSVDELTAVPGIGARLLQEIIEQDLACVP